MWDEKVSLMPSHSRGYAKPALDAARVHIEWLMDTPSTFWAVKSYGSYGNDETKPNRPVKLFNVGLEIRREVFG